MFELADFLITLQATVLSVFVTACPGHSVTPPSFVASVTTQAPHCPAQSVIHIARLLQ